MRKYKSKKCCKKTRGIKRKQKGGYFLNTKQYEPIYFGIGKKSQKGFGKKIQKGGILGPALGMLAFKAGKDLIKHGFDKI